MEKILKVHTVNDYARYIGAPEFLLGKRTSSSGTPLVSVIHYDELEHCRHSLNRSTSGRLASPRTTTSMPCSSATRNWRNSPTDRYAIRSTSTH